MRALMPFGGMSDFRKEMDRLFDRFFEPGWGEFEVMAEWKPRVDVSETKDAVVVKAELPGCEQKDVHVELQGDVLSISGEKRQEKEEKDEKRHRIERSWGSFMRTFRLPAAVQGDRVAAAFKDGLLTVTLPKAPSAKGTTIPVKGA